MRSGGRWVGIFRLTVVVAMGRDIKDGQDCFGVSEGLAWKRSI